MRRASWAAGLLALASVGISAVPGLDLAVSSRFHCPGAEAWCHGRQQPWEWFYRWGPLPGVICGATGVVMGALGALRRDVRLRARGLFLAGVLLIGPGILGNTTKPLWGRPRPRQIVEFGGTRTYQPVWRPTPGARGSSFPSGHVTTAFSLGGPALLVAHPLLRASLIAASLGYGTAMAVARLAQGAHFLSDAAWSATFAWVGILLSAHTTRMGKGRRRRDDLSL